MKLSDEAASGYKPVVPVGTAGAENRVHEAALRKRLDALSRIWMAITR